MPPRAPGLTSQFSVAEVSNEVVCPLTNQDGSHCRKRCLGEKRYRSMQEHIRRAHPEYYIAKLPATKESFEMMINTPPHDPPAIDPNHANHRPSSHHSQLHRQQQQQQQHHLQHSDPAGLSPVYGGFDAGLNSFEGFPTFNGHDGGYYTAGDTEAQAIYQGFQVQQRSSDEYRRGSLLPAASAAQALAQLSNRGQGTDWGGDDMGQNFYADQYNDMKTNHFHVDPALEDATFMPDGGMPPMSSSSDQPGLMPSSLAHSPPDRSSTLPPLQRSMSRQYNRPRKTSLSQQARMAKHERKRSKELSKRNSGDHKSFTEPTAAQLYGKRWEDLIDAAQSATEEEDSRDLTPIPASPYQSPQVPSRTSLPPFHAMGSQFQSFQASPLNRALTPPPPDPGLADLQPFASVDSSLSSNISHAHHNSADSSGSQFHIMNPNSLTTPSDTSPEFNPMTAGTNVSHERTQPIQIYCAGCRTPSKLEECFACTNCICGFCASCVDAMMSGQSRGRMSMCPKCQVVDASFKPFQLDLR